MNTRGPGNRGGGGPPRGRDDRRDPRRGEILEHQEVDDATTVDNGAVPPSRALAVPHRGSLLVRDSPQLPRVAARMPVGMATNEQVDSFRELRQRLQAMARGVGLGYFTTLVVPMTPNSGDRKSTR